MPIPAYNLGLPGQPRPGENGYVFSNPETGASYIIVDQPREVYPSANQLNRGSSGAGPQQLQVGGEGTLIPILYGTRRVAGRIFASTIYNGSLYVGVAWCMGEANAINSVQINDADVPATVTVTHYYGTTSQTADSSLVTAFAGQSPAITYSDTLTDPFIGGPRWGIAYSVFVIPPNVISGFPRFSAVVSGRKVIPVDSALTFNGSTSTAKATLTSSVTGDFEIILGMTLADYTPAAQKVLAGQWNITGNDRGWMLTLETDGTLKLWYSSNGTNEYSLTSSAALSSIISDSERVTIRVRFWTNKDAGGSSAATFDYSTDGSYFQALGTEVTGTTVASVYASTEQFSVFSGNPTGGPLYTAGDLFAAMLSTAAGGVLADLQAYEASSTSFSDPVDAAWTLANITAPSRAFSQRPIDVLCDLVTSSAFGYNKRIDQMTAMHVADLNDDLVGSKVRHQVDILLDSSQTIDSWLVTLRDHAHCWVSYESGRFFFRRDWDDDVVMSFDDSTIVAGSMKINKRGARKQPTVVEVIYTDTSTTPWKDGRVVRYANGVLNGTVPRRVSRISKSGITRYAEAYQYATERLNQSILNDLEITFNTFDEAFQLRTGDLIEVTHSIGFAAKKFRVGKVDTVAPGRYVVDAIEYSASQYSSDVVSDPGGTDTSLPSPNNPPTPTTPTVTEDLVQTLDGLYVSRIRVTLAVPNNYPFVRQYRVQVVEGGTTIWQQDVFASPAVTPPLKEQVDYTIRVAAVSTTGVISSYAEAEFTPQGKYLAPSDVPSLSGIEAGGRVYLTWTAATDLSIDVLRYELRYGDTGDTWDDATFIDRVSGFSYLTQGLPAGDYRFFIKALDSVGLYSDTATTVDVTVTVDDSAFRALSFSPASWDLFAATQYTVDGNTYAATDWGDTSSYGTTTVSDASGTYDDATAQDTDPFTQPHSRALHFDNSTSTYVNIPHAAGLNVGTTLSIDAWIFPILDDGATIRAIYSHGSVTGGTSEGAPVLMVKGDGTLYVNDVTTTVMVTSSAGVIANRKWHHVCLTIAGTGNTDWKLYVNGTLVGTSSTGYTAKDNSNAKRIGGTASGTYPFYGLISRVRLWDAALSATEVLQAMQYRGTDVTTVVGSGGLTAGNLKSSWLLNDYAQNSLSTTCTDQKSVSNGTVNGSVAWKSWDDVRGEVIDLGQVYSATFRLLNGPTAIEGTPRTSILLSTDGVTYVEYVGDSVTGQARYVIPVMTAEEGSAVYDLSNCTIQVNLTPRDEVGSATTSATSGVPAVVDLDGSYTQAISLQATPKLYSGASVTAMYDQIEVSGGRGMQTGRGLRFPGSNSYYVSVGDYSTFTFGNGTTDSPFSVECWIKIDSLGSVQPLIAKGSGNITGEWQLRVHTTGQLRLFLFDQSAVAYHQITSQLALTTGVWYHVAATYSGSNPTTGGVKLYVNGNEEPTNVVSGGTYVAMEDTTVNLIFGNQSALNVYFGGVLDEIRIWNDVRTADEIADNRTVEISESEAGLVGHWKFDETSGTSAADSQTNTTTHNGTLTGFGANTEKYWRPYDGFDLYCFSVGSSPAQVANELSWSWKGV